jgi:D-glycero-D-manno-heptose 1,7-bisphosphate phosphatase
MELFFSTPPATGATSAIFFDRDGVINERIVGGYVTQCSEFRFRPGILDALRELARLPNPIIVVSNQAGVGKGLFHASALEAVTRRFVECVQARQGRIDAVYYCTHTPEGRCGCRKPQPGLLCQAASRWRIDLSRSVLVGDSLSDVQAAMAVDCRAILIDPEQRAGASGFFRVRSTDEIAGCVRRCLHMTPASVPSLAH